ncbi:hypothetical protein DFJ58DRAFT_733311 [Suillus subalutaceus]|uniref:uncharacterized protein n=1 Tax=Suillus subalutaceus TaxID=48586 RepID=UPI001B882E12|nr:uncharacterized protein DFJ58DRAFT_733311 [Suillus subalutaceus]KAG1839443.1 hypothetical protein DFJ58DRAFT_733311 [Suillus subalutaceus]
MSPKILRVPNGRFTARKKSSNLSTSSSTATSAESSPLDTPELRTSELAANTSDSEHESREVQKQLGCAEEEEAEEDRESLTGALNPDKNTLPTFEESPELLKASSTLTLPFQPLLWPAPPITLTKPPTVNNPVKPQFITKAPVKPSMPLPAKKRMAGNTPNWFHRKADENAQNFLWDVDRYIVLNDLKTEAGKVMVFSTLLSAGSMADTWWIKLDSSKKTTWADVKTAFMERWPAIPVAEKTGLDYQREILALRLTDEEVGTQIMVAGVATWAHLKFHNNLQQLVSEAGVATTTGLVYQVQENLPTIMKELTTPSLAEWQKFLDEIKNIDTNKLREKAEGVKKKREIEKTQNARLARLESIQTDAVEVMRLQLQCMSIEPSQVGQAIPNAAYPSFNQSPRIRYST